MAEKIAVMGTHGVGKTTLVYHLADEAKRANPGLRVSILPEVARFCPFPLNRATTDAAQRWIFTTQIAWEIEWTNISDLLYCDRGGLENLAYAQLAGLKGLVDDFLPAAVRWMSTYAKTYFLRPLAHPVVADGLRPDDPVFQLEIDAILNDWVTRYQIPVLPRP